MGRDDAVRQQLVVAVCADRAGNAGRANQLYAWAAENRRLTPGEEEHFRESQPQAIWERLPYRACTLACLERWEEELEVAEQCQTVVSGDRRAQTSESYRTPLQVLDVIHVLARYKVNPAEEHRREACEKLDPQSIATRVHSSRLYSLFISTVCATDTPSWHIRVPMN